eukprot:365813-Chlamydomonas_euryale.AAC.17
MLPGVQQEQQGTGLGGFGQVGCAVWHTEYMQNGAQYAYTMRSRCTPRAAHAQHHSSDAAAEQATQGGAHATGRQGGVAVAVAAHCRCGTGAVLSCPAATQPCRRRPAGAIARNLTARPMPKAGQVGVGDGACTRKRGCAFKWTQVESAHVSAFWRHSSEGQCLGNQACVVEGSCPAGRLHAAVATAGWPANTSNVSRSAPSQRGLGAAAQSRCRPSAVMALHACECRHTRQQGRREDVWQLAHACTCAHLNMVSGHMYACMHKRMRLQVPCALVSVQAGMHIHVCMCTCAQCSSTCIIWSHICRAECASALKAVPTPAGQPADHARTSPALQTMILTILDVLVANALLMDGDHPLLAVGRRCLRGRLVALHQLHDLRREGRPAGAFARPVLDVIGRRRTLLCLCVLVGCAAAPAAGAGHLAASGAVLRAARVAPWRGAS